MNQLSFTVVGTSFNDAKIIEKYYASMTNQTLQPTEYLLVDGGSKDDTVARAERFGREHNMPIRTISGKRLNIAQGYNEAVKNCTTDIIIITGLGNQYPDNYFEALAKEYASCGKRIVYGPLLGIDSTYFAKIYNLAYLRGKKGWHCYIPTNRGVLIEKSVFDEVGYFYEDFLYAGEDAEFYKRCLSKGLEFGYSEDAKVYWESPKSWKEHLKKKNVYYLGDMQYGGHKKDLALAVAACLLILAAVGFCRTPWPYVLALLAYLAMALRIKTFHPLAVGLRYFDLALPAYLCLKNWKYHSKVYQMKREETK